MLTERQIREKEYYQQYALSFNPYEHIDLAPIEGPLCERERRPWNSYWRTYELSVDHYRPPMALLDFGCGPGDNALRFSHVGYKVTGFDICEENIKNCQKIFSLHSPEKKAYFIVSAAEGLPFADHSFDVVVGIDILHHVDIAIALKEVKRVLKDGGVAIFREPLEVPLLDKLRNSWPLCKLFPNTPSLLHHITADERKLNAHDLKIIENLFPDLTIERSLILSRFDKFLRDPGDKRPSLLEKIDYRLIKLFPFLSSFGGAAVITLKKDPCDHLFHHH